MNSKDSEVARIFLKQARHSLTKHHLPRITRCLRLLSEDDVWWRPNHISNSVGNLVLHLSGNVRQWIISGLGGKPDTRNRDKEFAERGPVPRRQLIVRLSGVVTEAAGVMARLDARQLEAGRLIQGFRVTGFQAVFHVAEHFAYHSGQIQYITKLKRSRDLGFTRLPGGKGKAGTKSKVKINTKTLPQL